MPWREMCDTDVGMADLHVTEGGRGDGWDKAVVDMERRQGCGCLWPRRSPDLQFGVDSVEGGEEGTVSEQDLTLD
jgi:hypothetical protein